MHDRSLAHADAAMEHYSRGDAAAFAVVFDAVAPHVHRFARRALREPAAADDVVQQTLLKMHRARGDFVPGAQVLPWAYTIARRLIIDHIRQRRRNDALVRQAHDALVPAVAAAPDAELVADELLAAMRTSFAALPEAQQEAYLLLRREGLSLAEAARRLGTTITAVKLRVYRVGVQLRACFGDARDKA